MRVRGCGRRRGCRRVSPSGSAGGRSRAGGRTALHRPALAPRPEPRSVRGRRSTTSRRGPGRDDGTSRGRDRSLPGLRPGGAGRATFAPSSGPGTPCDARMWEPFTAPRGGLRARLRRRTRAAGAGRGAGDRLADVGSDGDEDHGAVRGRGSPPRSPPQSRLIERGAVPTSLERGGCLPPPGRGRDTAATRHRRRSRRDLVRLCRR